MAQGEDAQQAAQETTRAKERARVLAAALGNDGNATDPRRNEEGHCGCDTDLDRRNHCSYCICHTVGNESTTTALGPDRGAGFCVSLSARDHLLRQEAVAICFRIPGIGIRGYVHVWRRSIDRIRCLSSAHAIGEEAYGGWSYVAGGVATLPCRTPRPVAILGIRRCLTSRWFRLAPARRRCSRHSVSVRFQND